MKLTPVGDPNAVDYSHVLTDRDKRVGRWIATTANLAMISYPVWIILTHLTF